MSVIVDVSDALITKIAEAISNELGTDEAMTYDVAKRVAEEWVAKERAAVTASRAAAVKRATRVMR